MQRWATWQGPTGVVLTFIADETTLTIKTTISLTYHRLLEIAGQLSSILLVHPDNIYHNGGESYTYLKNGGDQFTFVLTDVPFTDKYIEECLASGSV